MKLCILIINSDVNYLSNLLINVFQLSKLKGLTVGTCKVVL